MRTRNAERGTRNGERQSRHADFRLPSSVSVFRVPRSAFRVSAFTLVEILASLLFLAIAVPAIVGALGVASRTSEVTERSSIAGGLAENKLNELLVDNTWQSAAQSNGDFGADFPSYRWQMATQNWTGGVGTTGTAGTGTASNTTTTANTSTGNGANGTNSLLELSVEVFYPVQGNERNVRLTTLVNSSATATPSPSPSSGTSTTK